MMKDVTKLAENLGSIICFTSEMNTFITHNRQEAKQALPLHKPTIRCCQQTHCTRVFRFDNKLS